MSQEDSVQQRRLIELFGEIIFLSSDGKGLAEADLEEVDPNFSAELKASSLRSGSTDTITSADLSLRKDGVNA